MQCRRRHPRLQRIWWILGELNLYGYEDPITLKVGLAFNSDFEWQG